MEKRILMAGFGGQGIMFMGKLLAYASIKEGKNVTWLPSYGAQMRGGTANCMVVTSTQRIGSPYVVEPDCLIVMNRPSLDKFEASVQSGGLLMMNSSIIKEELKRKDLVAHKIPASDIAENIGNIRVSNMVALGAFVGVQSIVSVDALVDSLDHVLSVRHKEMLTMNKTALTRGFKMGIGFQKVGNNG